MSIQDNHNHFCIYCGAKLIPNQHFCSQCGKEISHDEEVETVQRPSEYGPEVEKIANEKLFDPSHMSYQKYTAAIEKSNGLFDNQLIVARKMIELDDGNNPVVKRELENKIKTLNSFIDKMEDLINELVIQLSSNKDDDSDINNLFSEMDDLIDSVKDY